MKKLKHITAEHVQQAIDYIVENGKESTRHGILFFGNRMSQPDVWAVVDKKTGKLVGLMNAMRISHYVAMNYRISYNSQFDRNDKKGLGRLRYMGDRGIRNLIINLGFEIKECGGIETD